MGTGYGPVICYPVRASRNQQGKEFPAVPGGGGGASGKHGGAQRLTTVPSGGWLRWGRGEQAEGGDLKRPSGFRADLKAAGGARGHLATETCQQ